MSDKSNDEKPTIFFACGPNYNCDHDFKGWREFDDGLGGETVCTKCGIGAMAESMWRME